MKSIRLLLALALAAPTLWVEPAIAAPGRTPAMEFPQFVQGKWSLRGGCFVDDQEDLVTFTRRTVNFYESTGRILAISGGNGQFRARLAISGGNGQFRARLAMSGEGQTWSETMQVQISRTGVIRIQYITADATNTSIYRRANRRCQ